MQNISTKFINKKLRDTKCKYELHITNCLHNHIENKGKEKDKDFRKGSDVMQLKKKESRGKMYY